jgi:hypothetical protein
MSVVMILVNALRKIKNESRDRGHGNSLEGDLWREQLPGKVYKIASDALASIDLE